MAGRALSLARTKSVMGHNTLGLSRVVIIAVCGQPAEYLSVHTAYISTAIVYHRELLPSRCKSTVKGLLPITLGLHFLPGADGLVSGQRPRLDHDSRAWFRDRR